MTVTANTSAANAALDAVADLMDGATLTIRSGAAPGAGATATGTVLAEITCPTPAFAAASGSVAKAGTWEDASADASGVAAHWRLVATGGAVLEGTVTATGGGGDMTVGNTTLSSGNPFTVTSFAITLTNLDV